VENVKFPSWLVTKDRFLGRPAHSSVTKTTVLCWLLIDT